MRVTSPDGWVIESDSADECVAMLSQLRGGDAPAFDIGQVCETVYSRLAPMITRLLEDIGQSLPANRLSWHIEKMADGTIQVEPVGDAQGVEEQFTPTADGKRHSYREVSPSFKKQSLKTLKPWTAPAVAMFADGAVPREVVRDIEGINMQQANYVRNHYSMEIAELARLPHGNERFKFLQDRFGFGGVPIDTTIGARINAKQA